MHPRLHFKEKEPTKGQRLPKCKRTESAVQYSVPGGFAVDIVLMVVNVYVCCKSRARRCCVGIEDVKV